MVDISISHYSTGTATVAANGIIVTFQNAGAISEAIRRGDLFGTHVGRPVRISETGPAAGLTANQIRLAYPWQGPTQTAAPYEIQRVPRDLGYRHAIEELITSVGEGNLPMFSALVAAANKLPYFDSDRSMALANITEKARALLGHSDNAGMQTEIGGSQIGRSVFSAVDVAAAQASLELVKQTDNYDVNGSRLMTVGAFGLGAGAQNIPDMQAADLTRARFFRVLSNAIGGPAWGSAGLAIPYDGTPSAGLLAIASSRMYRGWKNSPTAMPAWVELLDALNAQVVSNSNGSYVRLPGGLQICWRWMPAADLLNQSSGPLFRTGNTSWYFPASFAENPAVAGFSASGVGYSWVGLGAGATNTTQTTWSMWSVGSHSNTPMATIIAVGRHG